MNYIVSGFQRSGTSMMMNLLVNGGIQPYWSKKRETGMQKGNTENEINPGKFYEVGQENYMRLGMTSEIPDECCVKIMAIGLPILSAAKGYKIIYMRRDPELIKASYESAFPGDDFNRLYKNWPSYYWQLMDGVKGIMEARRDVNLLELWYDDVLENPEQSVDKILAFGFPVDKQKAIDTIDKKYRRFAA